MPDKSFASSLRSLRQERGLTVRGLASQSGLSPVWITLVENGHEQIGHKALIKLCDGLDLKGDEADGFAMEGLATNINNLLPKCSQYGPQINNAVALTLDRAGIKSADISTVSRTHEGEIALSDMDQSTQMLNLTTDGTTLWLTLANRKVAAVQIRVLTAQQPDRASQDALLTPQTSNWAAEKTDKQNEKTSRCRQTAK
jgi:transcriptional regulator with XRE-family HTH domain